MVMAARQFPSTSDMSPKPATQAASDAATHGHTSVIDQHVYGTECLPRGGDHGGHDATLADVGLDDGSATAHRPDFRCDRQRIIHTLAVIDGDIAPSLGQRQYYGPSDAPRSTRH